MPASTPLLPLFDSPPDAQPVDAGAAALPARAELWLALYFPRIALETVVGDPQGQVAAVTVRQRGRDVVHTATRDAEKAGVRRGMPLASARALCPALQVAALDRAAQRRRLAQLARVMQRFTPRIALCGGNALLLEVRGSLTYFGGLEAIRTAIAECFSGPYPHALYSAASPAAAASLLLARTGSSVTVADTRQLRSVLGGIAIEYLPLQAKQRQRLDNSGVQMLRDVWRLPADQLARRLGSGFVRYLDKLLGRRVDPRETFTHDPGFRCHDEFLYEITDVALIAEAARELLGRLCEQLYRRDAGINRFQLVFFHEQQSATRLEVGLSSTTRDIRRLCFLLETRLEGFTLVAPVISLELRAETLLPYRAAATDLFPSAQTERTQASNELDELLDELRLRLGDDAVEGISALPDHRPERASGYAPLTRIEQSRLDKPRPAWLLNEPLPLQVRDRRPCYRGPLTVLDGPERIESGWWEGIDTRRDYYTVATASGARLWIYRDLRASSRWYLHGLFA